MCVQHITNLAVLVRPYVIVPLAWVVLIPYMIVPCAWAVLVTYVIVPLARAVLILCVVPTCPGCPYSVRYCLTVLTLCVIVPLSLFHTLLSLLARAVLIPYVTVPTFPSCPYAVGCMGCLPGLSIRQPLSR